MLADQAASARSQSSANPHFALANRSAHEQYVGDVETRHQQHQCGQYREGHRYERQGVVGIGLGTRQFLWIHRKREGFVDIGMLFLNALRHRAYTGLGLSRAYPRLEPRQHANVAVAAIGPDMLYSEVGILLPAQWRTEGKVAV